MMLQKHNEKFLRLYSIISFPIYRVNWIKAVDISEFLPFNSHFPNEAREISGSFVAWYTDCFIHDESRIVRLRKIGICFYVCESHTKPLHTKGGKRIPIEYLMQEKFIMNTDQVKGSIKTAAGKVQQKAGAAVGSEKQQAKGFEKQAEGKLQKAAGNIKEAAKNTKAH